MGLQWQRGQRGQRQLVAWTCRKLLTFVVHLTETHPLSFCSVVKAIGLGFKTPQDAKDGCYIDKKCPWAGNVSIRGKLLRGVVVSTKMKRTLVIRRDYL